MLGVNCPQDEVKAFEIDERTFMAIDEDGHCFDDNLEEEEERPTCAADVPDIGNLNINEDLFDVDGSFSLQVHVSDLDDLDSGDEENEKEDKPGPSKTS